MRNTVGGVLVRKLLSLLNLGTMELYCGRRWFGSVEIVLMIVAKFVGLEGLEGRAGYCRGEEVIFSVECLWLVCSRRIIVSVGIQSCEPFLALTCAILHYTSRLWPASLNSINKT